MDISRRMVLFSKVKVKLLILLNFLNWLELEGNCFNRIISGKIQCFPLPVGQLSVRDFS